MKLVLVVAFLALICMARTVPMRSSSTRTLIIPDYHNDEHGQRIQDAFGNDDDDDYEEEEEAAITTTTRSTSAFPTRNRDLIPTRRSVPTETTTSIRTTSTTKYDFDAASVDDDNTFGEYDGDFKYLKKIRRAMQRFFEELKKLMQKITGSEYFTAAQQRQSNQYAS
ncbi:unnamed protein product [Rotaria magnacalcarata]|uniref:Uncharacterized protein n=2 Tax=Rotaria magnacalcarata TaxID=392030 RepID=A0A814GAU8_9BILA|nr:unnamed protein product [Rotaria magnacalcarata]CAF1643409.1 unnamed protein product [Rotaria magnacalcarata]